MTDEYLTKEDLRLLINVSKKGIIATFTLMILMLFHVLIEFFYHL